MAYENMKMFLQAWESIPFREWEEIARQIPALAAAGTLRARVESMAPVDLSLIKTDTQVKHAYTAATFICHAYMNGTDDVQRKFIPWQIGQPWHALAQRLGITTVFTLASAALYNYELIDPTLPMSLENLRAVFTFTGTRDEEWFFVVMTYCEYLAWRIIKIFADDPEDLSEAVTLINEMGDAVDRTREHCQPNIFFNVFRPYIVGPKGVKIGGTDVELTYNGGSSAQSTGIKLIDAFLDVHYTGKMARYLEGVKPYMPRADLAVLEGWDNFELTGTGKADCQQAMHRMRSIHRAIAHDYVVVFIGGNAEGSGGTLVNRDLTRVLIDTENARRRELGLDPRDYPEESPDSSDDESA